MNKQQIYDFVHNYLQATECEILEQGPHHIRTRLSTEADKDITGRYYYWLFVERTGAPPQTLDLTFIFDNDRVGGEIKGERIEFGCWRLHQIFESAQKKGQFVRLYEKTSPANLGQEVSKDGDGQLNVQMPHTPGQRLKQGLMPWLCLNYKISYISDQKKDRFYPLGFNLCNGEIVTGFDQTLDHFLFTPKIPDYHFTLAPVFSLKSALDRCENFLKDMLGKEEHIWAEQAHRRLDEERDLVHSFFDREENEQHMLQTRLDEIELYRPRIEVYPINVGLFYMQSHPAIHLNKESTALPVGAASNLQ